MTSINITSNVVCPCGCDEAVTFTTGGFATTTGELAACSKAKAAGIISYTVPKSAGLSYRRAS